jgi:hypothetical protein
MMKYILTIVYLMHAASTCGMNNESAAQRLKVLKEMGADNKAANRNMETLIFESTRDEDRELTLHLMQRKLKAQADLYDRRMADQDEEYQRSLKEHQESQMRIAEQNQNQIDRLVVVVERQTGTISNLNGLIQAILRKTYKTEINVATQAQDINEMKQITGDHVGNLLQAVGDQTELISRQNKIIGELSRKVEDLSQTLAKLQKLLNRLQNTISLHEERLKQHDRMHVKARQMLMAATAVFTNQQIEMVIKMLEEPDLPVVASDESDPEIERQVLGSGSGSVSLGDDPEAIAQFNLRLVSQEKIKEDLLPTALKEDIVPEDDEQLKGEKPDEKQIANDWELVAEYEEEIVPSKEKQEASGE